MLSRHCMLMPIGPRSRMLMRIHPMIRLSVPFPMCRRPCIPLFVVVLGHSGRRGALRDQSHELTVLLAGTSPSLDSQPRSSTFFNIQVASSSSLRALSGLSPSLGTQAGSSSYLNTQTSRRPTRTLRRVVVLLEHSDELIVLLAGLPPSLDMSFLRG